MKYLKIKINFFEKTLNELLNIAQSLTYDKTNPLHLYSLSFYGTILELCSGLIILLKTDRITCIPIILRSIIEAYIDMDNLLIDPQYGYSLEIKGLSELIKFCDEVANDEACYEIIAALAPDYKTMIESAKQRKKELEDMGHKPLKQYDKFSKAGLIKDYKILYKWLCMDTHSDYSALQGRHLDINNNTISVQYFKETNFDRLKIYIDIATDIVITASISIHKHFSPEKVPAIEKLKFDLGEIKKHIDLTPKQL